MASIRWYRSGGKRVLTPRRDNPKSPKSIKPKRPKKLGRPRYPKIRKPRVMLPFVQAVDRSAFNSNLSSAGLSAVMKIAEANGLEIGTIRWIRGSHTELECPPAYEGALEGICDALARRSWDGIGQFMSEMRGSGDGIWGVSHINCTCHISLRLFDPSNPGRHAIFEVFTNPIDGVNPMGSGSTIAGGYALAGGNIPEDQIAGLSFKQVTDLNKMDSTDKDVRREYKNKEDIFDQQVRPSSREWYDNDPAFVAQPPAGAHPITEPPVAAEPAPAAEPTPLPTIPRAKPELEPELTPEEEERRRKEEEAQKGFLG